MKDPVSLRREFPGAEEFGYRFGPTVVNATQVGVRSMNFGQPWRGAEVQDLPYSVRLPDLFFLDILESSLPDFVSDAKEFPDDSCELERELRALDWPPAPSVVGIETLRLLALQWFAHEMLLRWFGDGDPDRLPGFVINTIDGVSFDGSHPVISGNARPAGEGRTYQDK